MRMKKTADLCASVGEYKDRETGQMRKRWVNVGVEMTDPETGRRSLKLEVMPVVPEWSGWLSVFPVEERGEGNHHRGHSSAKTSAGMAGKAQSGFEDEVEGDDIPF